MFYPFPKGQGLDSFKCKEFTDDKFEFDENCRTGRKLCLKKRNLMLRTISPFPTVFSKDLYGRYVKTRGCLGKGERQNTNGDLQKGFQLNHCISVCTAHCLEKRSILREKCLAGFFTSLIFVYKSMSLKRFHIEQLCPSIDGMISLVFVHYAIM